MNEPIILNRVMEECPHLPELIKAKAELESLAATNVRLQAIVDALQSDQVHYPIDWELFEESGCPRCGCDIVADPGCEGGGFSDGAAAICSSCGLKGGVTAYEDGTAGFTEDEEYCEKRLIEERDKATELVENWANRYIEDTDRLMAQLVAAKAEAESLTNQLRAINVDYRLNVQKTKEAQEKVYELELDLEDQRNTEDEAFHLLGARTGEDGDDDLIVVIQRTMNNLNDAMKRAEIAELNAEASRATNFATSQERVKLIEEVSNLKRYAEDLRSLNRSQKHHSELCSKIYEEAKKAGILCGSGACGNGGIPTFDSIVNSCVIAMEQHSKVVAELADIKEEASTHHEAWMAACDSLDESITLLIDLKRGNVTHEENIEKIDAFLEKVGYEED